MTDPFLGEAQLVMSPLIRDLDIKMWAFIAGVTFDDSSTQRQWSSSLFDLLGNGSGTYMYRLIRGPNVPNVSVTTGPFINTAFRFRINSFFVCQSSF